MKNNKSNRIKELKAEIKELEKRMPAHSINIEMMEKLEELKTKLEKLQTE